MSSSPINGPASNPHLAAYGTSVLGAVAPSSNANAKAASAAPPPRLAAPTPEDVKIMVADIQRKVASVSPELQFSVDQQSGQPIVTMTDKTTMEVLWQFPSDEVLQVRKALDQYQRGTLVNHKA